MSEQKQQPDKSEWYLTPEEASRVARGHREMMNLPPTTPIAPRTAIASGPEEKQVKQSGTGDSSPPMP
jgi:hypothetical protein